MRKYLVFTPAYSVNSGGPKVLHQFCHELNLKGQEAYVNSLTFSTEPIYLDPNLKTPYYGGLADDSWIAVYPEVIYGNPWGASSVARYVLNNPGKLAGDKVYAPYEMVFVFSEMFNDIGVPPEHILFLPTIDTNIFYDKHLPRTKKLFYVGKGWKNKEFDPDFMEISRETAKDQENLSDILNRAEILYTFDNITGMTELARLCGCPVVIIPNGEYTKEQYNKHEMGWDGLGWNEVPPPFDSQKFMEKYLALKDLFDERLDYFIEVTQKGK